MNVSANAEGRSRLKQVEELARPVCRCRIWQAPNELAVSGHDDVGGTSLGHDYVVGRISSRSLGEANAQIAATELGHGVDVHAIEYEQHFVIVCPAPLRDLLGQPRHRSLTVIPPTVGA